ncbi:MAG TPA: DUF2381 family protein [Hyalangium sp.]|nr:DUF2381 family protein [Hyalangium sp.]
MLRLSGVSLVALLLLAGPAVAQPVATLCKGGVRRVELPAVPTGKIEEVCISPWLATTFSFDADVVRESITLEGRERFAKVDPGDSTLKLVPSEKLVPGERLKLTLRFKDGAAPASTVFTLVVQAAQADTYVEVHREKRTVESCQQELKESAAELQQCRAENEQLRAAKGAPDGLRGLIVTGEIDKDTGITPMKITRSIAPRPGNPFNAPEVTSYRSKRGVAVQLKLAIPAGAAPFTLGGAKLEAKGQGELAVLAVWPLGPLAPDPEGRALVIVEAKAGEAQGSFTLTLWGEPGQGKIIIDKVTFP